MEEYKIVELRNSYTDKDISSSLPVLNYAGVETVINSANIIFKFDVVDLKYLKSVKTNPLIVKFVEELYKIHSFSTSNGKVIFKSFNKDRKVRDKNENKEKTLAYKYYRKCFSEENTELNSELVNKVYCADSLVFLRELPDNCIDMILTSPPYNFGISYNNTNDVNMWENYFNILFSIFKECIRVLKSGGRIVVNIQPMFSDYVPTHHFISNFFIKEGLIWKGEIIWEKNNYNCKYCTWGSWRSPSSPYLKYSWEFVEIFCKNHLRKDGDKDDIDIEAEEFKKWVYSKWSIAPERKMKEFKHDAMFPEELAKRAVKLFSYKNDIVLDPFDGTGTTTKVASQLERRFIGIDIDPEYCNTAKKRLEETATLFDWIKR
jgi:DNA modification methylase